MKYVFGFCVFLALLTWSKQINSLQAGPIDCALPLPDLTASACTQVPADLLILHLGFWLAAYLLAYSVVALLRFTDRLRVRKQNNLVAQRAPKHPADTWA